MIGIIDRDLLVKFAKQDKQKWIDEQNKRIVSENLTARQRDSLISKVEKESSKKVTPTCKWIKNRYTELYQYATQREYDLVVGIGAGVGKTTFAIKHLKAEIVSSVEETIDKNINKFVIVSASDRVKSLRDFYAKAKNVYVINCSDALIESQRRARINNPSELDIYRDDLEICINAPVCDILLNKVASFCPSAILVENDGENFTIKGKVGDLIPSLEKVKEERKKLPPQVATIGNFATGPTLGHDRLLNKLLKISESYNTKPIVFISPAIRPVEFQDGKSLSLNLEDKIQSFKDAYGDTFEYRIADWNDSSNLPLNVVKVLVGTDRYNDQTFKKRFLGIFDEAQFEEINRTNDESSCEGFSSSAAREALAKKDFETFFKIQGEKSSHRYLVKYGII